MFSGTEVICREVRFGSSEYGEAVQLRCNVLRQPLGLTFCEEELAAEKTSFHLTAWVAGKLAACAVLKPLPQNRIRMRQLGVLPELEGQGIGRSLVSYCELFIGELGCGEIVLHARESALGFYEKLGYRIEG